MGKLRISGTTLPKKILLQGWANDEGGVNINGEYTYTINFDISIIQGGSSTLYNGYKHNTLNSFIYFAGGWQFLTTADPNQWDNPSTNSDILPLNGWIENNAQGPAGTITILENDTANNIFTIRKQNTGSGKLVSRKFTPKDITSLALWLTSDAGVTLNNNNYVTLWEDQSGNNRNFTNPQNLGITSTGLPTFNNGALYFTSLQPFDDPNASILAMQSELLNFTTPYTLFHVFRKIGNFTGLSKSGDTTKRRKYQFSASNNTYYAYEANSDVTISYFDAADNINTKRLYCQKFNSNNSGALRYNGIQVSSGSANYSIDETNSNPVFIGASPFSLQTPGFNAEASKEAYIYEIIFYNKALDDTEIYKIDTYLIKKYSIY